MNVFGSVSAFDSSVESISEYIDRFDAFVGVNRVDEDWKANIFLAVIGANNFKLLKQLCNPVNPNALSYKQLRDTLKRYYEPEPIVIAERHKFWKALQGKEETMAEFVERLKDISSNCNFGSFLEEALRDKLVCGLHSRFYKVQMQLLSTRNLTFEMAEAKCLEAEEPHNPYYLGTENKSHENIPSSSANQTVFTPIRKWENRPTINSVQNPSNVSEGNIFLEMNSQVDSNPVNGKIGTSVDHFFSMQECLDLIMLVDESDALPKIPDGPKSNVYYVINITEYVEGKMEGKKMQFVDDYDSWDSGRNKESKSSYIINPSTKTCRSTKYVRGRYCVPKRTRSMRGIKETVFVPLEQQPDPKDIVVMYRYHSFSLISTKYRRRISWFEFPVGFPQKNNLAVVEYLGTYPEPEQCAPHDNSNSNEVEYGCADPETRERRKTMKRPCFYDGCVDESADTSDPDTIDLRKKAQFLKMLQLTS